MLNALLIANARSGASRWLTEVEVPGRWVLDPAAVTARDVAQSDLIAFFAGDGTVQKTLSQLLRTLPVEALPPLAVLPFGTTNMDAADINRQQRRRSATASLERTIRTGRFERSVRPLLHVQDGERNEHGFFFGMGVIAEVVSRWHTARSDKAATNRLRILRAMASGLRSADSTHTLMLDGQSHSVYGLMATTLDRLLLRSRPYWGDGSADDVRLTWVEATAAHLLWRAPALLRGSRGLSRVPGYESRSASRFVLSFAGPYILDGEIFHTQSESLTIDRSEPLTWIVL